MGITCTAKHTSKRDITIFLLVTMQLCNIIFVNILEGAYRIANICFLFGKYEGLRSEILTEFSFIITVEECRFFPDFIDMFHTFTAKGFSETSPVTHLNKHIFQSQ